MANGELLLSNINSVQLYTYQALRYLTEPIKYGIRDLSFYEGSARFTEVISNLSINQEDKDSLVAQVNYTDYSHLDLPVNYKALIDAVVSQEKTYLDIRSDFEFSDVKLARSLYDLIDYFTGTHFDYRTIRLTEYINSMGSGDIASEQASLANISNLLNIEGITSILTNVLDYRSPISVALSTYMATQTAILPYLHSLYSLYKTDSYKPNSLPYIAIKV